MLVSFFSPQQPLEIILYFTLSTHEETDLGSDKWLSEGHTRSRQLHPCSLGACARFLTALTSDPGIWRGTYVPQPGVWCQLWWGLFLQRSASATRVAAEAHTARFPRWRSSATSGRLPSPRGRYVLPAVFFFIVLSTTWHCLDSFLCLSDVTRM